MKNDIKLSETVVVSLNSILPISVTRTELNFGLLMLREEGGVGGGGWGAMNPPKPADEFGRVLHSINLIESENHITSHCFGIS